jgi:uncharacterized membrane protein YidH (DUF202 family)
MGFLIIVLLLTAIYTFGIIAWEERNEKPKTRELERLKYGSIGMFIVSLVIVLAIVFAILQVQLNV